MADTNKLKAGALSLNGLPDWVKIAVLLLTVFGAGGGGSHLLGRDYTPQFDKMDRQFEKLDVRLETIEKQNSELRDRVTRLEVRLESLRNAK